MANALKFKHTNVPRQQGERARLKVVQGPDYGAVYVVTGTKVSIGRGEDCDVVISDLKASRRHAEVSVLGAGWNVKDLGSANGILYNGKASRMAALRSSDTITLGETTLEFIGGEAPTQMLTAPPRTYQQIQADLAQQKKVKSIGQFGAMGGGPAAASGAKKPSPLLIVVGLGAAAMFLLPAEETPKKKTSTKKESKDTRDLASYLPDMGGGATGKTVDMFMKSGFREYRARNYLRAKQQFETVLQMSPGHPLATLYLDNSTKAIDDEIKTHLDRGRRDMSSGKLKAASWHFEAVMRLLERDQSNPKFIEARDQLDKVTKEMKGGVS